MINGTGQISYTLDGGPSNPTGLFTELGEGTLALMAQDHLGCVDSMLIELNNLGEISLESIDIVDDACELSLGSIDINADGLELPLMYSIDGSNFNSDSYFTGLTAGLYDIAVMDAIGCSVHKTIELTTTEGVELTIINPPLLNCDEQTVELPYEINGGTPPYDIYAVNTDKKLYNNLIALPIGIYDITVVDDQGCSQVAPAVIAQQPCNIYIPNVISRSSVQGNHEFRIVAQAERFFISHFVIADRWGNVMYEQEDIDSHEVSEWWTGYFRDTPVATGVYVYNVSLVIGDDTAYEESGTVTVMD